MVFKLTGKDTGDAVSVLEATIEPGRLVPPHMHENEDEDSYVLEGEIEVRVGDQEFQAAAGSYVLKPRGIPHTFWNTGIMPARVLEIITPAGLEQYFREISQVLTAGGPPNFGQLTEIRDRYHLHDVDWGAELLAKHGLTLLGQ